MKRIIASKVNEVRKMSWTEKKLYTDETIGRRINIITLINEIRGVIAASVNSIAMNIMMSLTGLLKI